METCVTIYQGQLRTQTTHVKSGYQIITDVPAEHGGRGESFSPTDLFCASLVSSMLTAMGGIARDPSFNGNFYGIKTRTTKTMSEKPGSPGNLSGLVIEFEMPKNGFTDDQRKRLEGAVRNSLVGKVLSTELKQTLIFNY